MKEIRKEEIVQYLEDPSKILNTPGGTQADVDKWTQLIKSKTEQNQEFIMHDLYDSKGKIIELLMSLKQSPSKGKTLGVAAGLTIKELKYKSFRFYFITDGFKLKCLNEEGIVDLLIKFVRMSDKKTQQKTINEIKKILQILSPSGFY